MVPVVRLQEPLRHRQELKLFEWYEEQIVIIAIIVVVLVILIDEIAYYHWKQANPGAMYSHLRDKTIPLVDPSRPPTVYYE